MPLSQPRSLPSQSLKDLPNLDVLRTMAVLQVFFGHLLMAFGVKIHHLRYEYYADLGVALFFVHTCLVLMWSLERNPDTLGFYVRRAFRIYPLAIVIILVVVGFRIPVGIDLTHSYSGLVSKWQLPTNLLLVQNLAHQPNVMGPLWTLPVELQMYLLLPFLYFFVRQNTKFWPLLLLWTASFGLNISHAHVWYWDPNYLPVVIPIFLPGVIAYVGFRRLRPIFPGWSMPIMLLAIGYLATRHQHLIVESCFALVVGLILPLFRQIQSKPFHGVCFQIAKYSYGIYLIHPFGILVCVFVLHDHALALRLLALGAVMLAVFPAYHMVEAPAIAIGRRIGLQIARSDGIATFEGR